MEKQLDYRFAKYCNERAEKAREQENARAYCVQKSRAREKAKRDRIETIKISIVILVLAVACFIKAFNSDYTYAVPTVDGGYEYVTESLGER